MAFTNPKVLIMNDPTRGIDVGAKVEIYKVMEELCQEGISIIIGFIGTSRNHGNHG